MTVRHTVWPRQWLMTDERMGDRLWAALERLPPGSGVVLRHYSLAQQTRRALAERVAAACHDSGHLLAVAGDLELARAVAAGLVHNRTASGDLPCSQAVHSVEEAVRAGNAGASLVFVSPVYPTSSHPGQPALGHGAAIAIARAASVPAIAMGGMDAAKFETLKSDFYGWAAIDAWLR